MKTLDRYIMRNFLTSVAMWFVVFMALRLVSDLFLNMDEFVKLNKTFHDLSAYILTYYGWHSLVYFTELGGVIIVASAAFTLAMMNHTNELTAMMASGVSLRRVVVPIVLCSVLLSGLIILDEELIIPQIADKLVRSRDDVFGTKMFPVRLLCDGDDSVWYSPWFHPEEQMMESPIVLIRDSQFHAVARLSGREAHPAVSDDGQPGWVIYDGVLSRLRSAEHPWEQYPRSHAIYTAVDPNCLLASDGQGPEGEKPIDRPRAFDAGYTLTLQARRFVPDPYDPNQPRGGTLVEPRFFYRTEDGNTLLGVFVAGSARWVGESHGRGYWSLEGWKSEDGKVQDVKLFHPSDLTTEDLFLRRTGRWVQYMSTSQLTRLLHLKRVPDPQAALLAKHVRFTEVLNNLVMLLLGLPFILSRERNIKASATLCLAVVAAFYCCIYLCRYIGLPPTLAAWLPALAFGPISVVMLDTVKT